MRWLPSFTMAALLAGLLVYIFVFADFGPTNLNSEQIQTEEVVTTTETPYTDAYTTYLRLSYGFVTGLVPIAVVADEMEESIAFDPDLVDMYRKGENGDIHPQAFRVYLEWKAWEEGG